MARPARALLISLAAAALGCSSCGSAPSRDASPGAQGEVAPSGGAAKPHGSAMNKKIQPFNWIRSGASVYLARIASVRFEPAGGGQRVTTIELAIEASLYGPRGAASRKVEITEPESELARAKFPTPQWGGVELAAGVLVLLATAELGEEVKSPLYVEQVKDAADPALAEVRDVLSAESASKDPAVRRPRYLGWLASAEPNHALFGGEALARDEDLPDVDPHGEVAAAFARAVGVAKDPSIRANLIEWMWSGIYGRTNEAGRVTLINASLRGAADPDEDVRRVALDKLSEAEMKDFDAPGIAKEPAAVPFLEDRLAEETAPEPRARLKKLIEIARP
jgi:hypothetical protein